MTLVGAEAMWPKDKAQNGFPALPEDGIGSEVGKRKVTVIPFGQMARSWVNSKEWRVN